MASVHYCPKCGGKQFITVAHISQDWKVDECGNFLEIHEACLETVVYPDDNNTWVCANYGANAEIVRNHPGVELFASVEQMCAFPV